MYCCSITKNIGYSSKGEYCQEYDETREGGRFHELDEEICEPIHSEWYVSETKYQEIIY